MCHRFSLAGALAVMAVACLGATPAAAQVLAAAKATSATPYTPPRTPDGQPDIQGIWSNASNVPLERPKNLGAKEFYTPEELAEAQQRARQPQANQPAVHYDLSQFGLDRAHNEIAPDLRTSLIVGPTGRIPPMLPQAQQRAAERAAKQKGHEFDGPENRGLAERCLVWGNEGPPMLPVGYNSNMQIVQGPGYVAILLEMIHDVRVIPLDGRPHAPKNIHEWLGDSRGHWEGNTLVVDTTNFTDKTHFRGSGPNLHVVERFTRTAPGTILYQFTVDDPDTWATSWSGEVPMVSGKGPLFEYACHEGNYGMANVLSGARAAEKAAAEKAAAAGKTSE